MYTYICTVLFNYNNYLCYYLYIQTTGINVKLYYIQCIVI